MLTPCTVCKGMHDHRCDQPPQVRHHSIGDRCTPEWPLSVVFCPDCSYLEELASPCCRACGSKADPVRVLVAPVPETS